MFRTRPEARPATIEVTVDGTHVRVPPGASAAAAILLAGAPAARETVLSGAPRLPWCLMGVCFDCLAEIDGISNRQSCMIPAAPGMRIARQRGARAAMPAPVTPDSAAPDPAAPTPAATAVTDA